MTNCPNCGAPAVGSICQYCGTRILDDSEECILYTDWRAVTRFTVEREMLELENELVQAKANAAISQQLQYLINGR